MEILKGKNAIIYGAGGSLGSTIAKAFAQAGAGVFLTGRNIGPLQKVAHDIIAEGGIAEADQVDALNEKEITDHIQKVVDKAGTIDIVYNAIDLKVVQGMPLIDMTVDDFTRPVNIAMRTHFLTATSAAKIMIKQKSGVILSLTATPGGIGYPHTAGFAPACGAMESFSRNLAIELGQYGIRVVNMRSAGSPDSMVFKEAIANDPEMMKDVIKQMEADTMLKKLPLMADIGNVAVFLSSDLAGKITGVTVDVTCGTTAGLNYRVPTKSRPNKI
ncbi:SDR family NAD(P)-dependent oxidoreductase [Mucilaginibacter sp. X4EP1]|uniref:SDR family NAD(P)-dependent oxidoreductase n=1 Tax=Mucilaginibacter sp. X4EP1 TaxID=2723092 RepID=UPI002169FCF9|nr:SDR family oxidoreductase [Mucilaginibacter sp. X4EP1]MCS3812390.1 NAD(P)-dependent dehydrogenase (short-subunit alcohol dehydrogenase family) [Mucilaginibacter sp. X4EP1]